jgi:hypothetical protein
MTIQQTVIRDIASSTLVLNDHVFTSLQEGDRLIFAPVNPASSHVRGTNSVALQDHSGKNVYDVTINVMRSTDDDIFMKSILNAESLTSLAGTYKESYTLDGSDKTETWTLEAGSITTQPTDTKNSTDGNELRTYTVRFNRAVSTDG